MSLVIILSLILITAIIFLIQKKIWSRYPNIILPVFIILIYYWSLAGAWFFCFDQITGWGEYIGMQYHYLLIKMFPVHLDSDYLLGLWLMGLFIIILQLLMLFSTRLLSNAHESIRITNIPSSIIYAVFALSFFAVSLSILYDVIIYSLILNESVYLNVRSSPVPFYTIHQLACWAMMLSLTIPIALALRRHKTEKKIIGLGYFFWFVFALCNFYLIFIGTRHELVLCGLTALLFITYPNERIYSYRKLYVTFIFVWLAILTMNDPFRSLSPRVGRIIGLTSLVENKQTKEESYWYSIDRTYIEHKQIELSKNKLLQARSNDTLIISNGDTVKINKQDILKQWSKGEDEIEVNGREIIIPNPYNSTSYQDKSLAGKIFKSVSGIIFSNELFAGHFSMYGILHHHVRANIGISFRLLIRSFVPSFINNERPESAYEYYASQLNLPSDQGFTINHIAAWYLNFSVWGILLGPIVLYAFLFVPLYVLNKFKNENYKVAFVFTLCCITAFEAMIIRSGPEAIKTWLFEGIIIPIILYFTIYKLNGLLSRKKCKPL